MKTLHLEGSAEAVVRSGLLLYRAAIKKARVKDEELTLDTAEHDDLDEMAKSILTELGWKPKEKGGRVEVTGGPDGLEGQLGMFDGGKPAAPEVKTAVVQCFGCSGKFVVPSGHGFYRCPTCSCVHRVTTDDEGVVYRLSEAEVMPAEIRALAEQRDAKEPALTEEQVTALDTWLAEHPEHVRLESEIVTGGELAPAAPEEDEATEDRDSPPDDAGAADEDLEPDAGDGDLEDDDDEDDAAA